MKGKSMWLQCFSVAYFMAISPVFADSQSTADNAAKLSSALQRRAAEELAAEADRDPLLPGPGAVVSGLQRAVPAKVAGRTLWFIPIQIHYKALNNRFCRLAVLSEDAQNARLIPIPANSLRDTCKGIGRQWFVDASGTGSLDVVQAIQIPSNRGLFDVTEAIVYLASASSESGYCVSTQAGKELSPESLRYSGTAAAALRSARARLGIERFACDP